ncbi:MAG: cysteine hydrolase family protein [Planctomycetota bacterium]|jgi:nicotinamidase-related amidase|nr:cysteine hydrolase family protein [Planctomycetota bacterium]MDP7129089.1 cysteine hydrolase family protein [Planctomycetota bacterium]MDP7250346.1 cysteine hydrolase family protein [Planctomycetota bacterium]
MPSPCLRVRYFQDSTPEGTPCVESNFIRREIDMPLPHEQTALVLVDLWNIHFIESWLERAKRVMEEKVLPMIEAARKAGMLVVHAPSPPVAAQYPEHRPEVPPKPVMPTVGPDWPPSEFRARQGDYEAYLGPRSQPPGIGFRWNPMKDQLNISPSVEVVEGEPVISDAHELHHVLARHEILHLVYAGFATNWCLVGRDYGIRNMCGHGYNIVALREATTGVEFPDTVESCFVTEVTIREIEQQYGFSASNQDFEKYCSAR